MRKKKIEELIDKKVMDALNEFGETLDDRTMSANKVMMSFPTGKQIVKSNMYSTWMEDAMEEFSINQILDRILDHCKLEIVATSLKRIPKNLTIRPAKKEDKHD